MGYNECAVVPATHRTEKDNLHLDGPPGQRDIV